MEVIGKGTDPSVRRGVRPRVGARRISADGRTRGNRARGVQAKVNAAIYSSGALVRSYARRDLRPVEVILLARYRTALSGRVLELGCGGGRLTGYVSALGGDVHGIDVSAAMVSYCRDAYPEANFEQRDLRDLSGYPTGSFDAVLAPFNVLDVLDDADRRTAVDEIGRILADGGLLIMSTHNRAAEGTIREPAWVFSLDPMQLAANLVRLPRSLRNRRRLVPFQRYESDYAILNDCGHSYSLLHYYVTRQDQARRFGEQGFELLECLDLDGRAVSGGDDAADCTELHYVARLEPVESK